MSLSLIKAVVVGEESELNSFIIVDRAQFGWITYVPCGFIPIISFISAEVGITAASAWSCRTGKSASVENPFK